MDEDRRIRFLVAPVLFVASLVIGYSLDQTHHEPIASVISQFSKDDAWSKLIILIAGGGLVVFVAGYVIGTITYFCLRLIFLFRPRQWGRFHEVALTDDSFGQVWRTLGAPGNPDRSKELFAGVVFDHDLLRKSRKGVHLWLFRRWNAFSVATTSFTGLLLSLPFGRVIGIRLSCYWFLSVAIFEVVLAFVMVCAWRDTMKMLNFTAALPPTTKGKRGPD